MTATRNRHGSAVITLPSDLEILIVRTFNAPAALIFKALTTPELVKRWWGYETATWKVCEIDFRVGGKWRYVAHAQGYGDVGFHGEYQEIDAPRRIVNTEVFEGFPDAGTINTMTLEEVDGITTMTVRVLHQTKEYRDTHINSAGDGVQVSYDRLEDLLGSMVQAA